jgi:hypothetical protein
MFRQFTQKAIFSIRHGLAGVYGIFSGETCIYLGMAYDVRERMLEHVTHQSYESECIFEHSPTAWAYEGLPPQDLYAREAELAAELKPVCGRES